MAHRSCAHTGLTSPSWAVTICLWGLVSRGCSGGGSCKQPRILSTPCTLVCGADADVAASLGTWEGFVVLNSTEAEPNLSGASQSALEAVELDRFGLVRVRNESVKVDSNVTVEGVSFVPTVHVVSQFRPPSRVCQSDDRLRDGLANLSVVLVAEQVEEASGSGTGVFSSLPPGLYNLTLVLCRVGTLPRSQLEYSLLLKCSLPVMDTGNAGTAAASPGPEAPGALAIDGSESTLATDLGTVSSSLDASNKSSVGAGSRAEDIAGVVVVGPIEGGGIFHLHSFFGACVGLIGLAVLFFLLVKTRNCRRRRKFQILADDFRLVKNPLGGDWGCGDEDEEVVSGPLAGRHRSGPSSASFGQSCAQGNAHAEYFSLETPRGGPGR